MNQLLLQLEKEPGNIEALREVFRLAPSAGGLSPSRYTPLVGRDADLSQLEGAWSQARHGAPRIVSVSGDAGIGKSRLLRELHARVGDEGWIECRCLEQNQASPLRPLVELLERLEGPIELTLERCGMDLEQNVPLFRDLLGAERERTVSREAAARVHRPAAGHPRF